MLLRVVTLVVFGYVQFGSRSNALPIEDAGYTFTPGIGYHKVHSLAKTWAKARSICQEEGGDLAIINSEEEQRVITELHKLSRPHNGAYDSNYVLIGWHDPSRNGHYVTIENETLSEAGFEKWADNEPDVEVGFENCGSLHTDGGLNDIACHVKYGFVCEQPEHVDVKINVKVADGPFFEGGEIIIACDVSGYPTPELQWYKDDSSIQTNNRISISGNTLVITGANKNDTGLYTCDAANGYTCDVRKIDVVVAVPEPVEATIAKKDGPFFEGDEISIACNASGYPTPELRWYKNDKLIQANDRTKMSGNTLIVFVADKTDTGTYRCDATNGYTSVTRTVDIVVNVPAEVKITVRKGPFFKGNSISITCNAEGFPIPKVLWYKDDILIRLNDRIKTSANTLIISTADESDAGQYSCKAFNKHSSSLHTVDIVVAEPVKVKLAATKGPFRHGREIGIDCHVAGYPIPTVTWYKDGYLIRSNNRIKIAANKLTISAAEKNDAGSYSCDATNGYTSAARSVEIIISEPVEVKLAAPKGPFRQGQEIGIACKVAGYPIPTVTWYKDGNLIRSNNRIKIAANKLTISAAEKNDAGSYSCDATNGYTSAARSVEIIISEPVEVKLAAPKGPFRQGQEIGIACKVAGYPIPTVTWYKDGNLIRSNNRIKIAANKLTISAAEKNDAGSYSCDATNGYTSAARSVEIIISEPVEVKLAAPKGPFGQGWEIGIACKVAGYPIPTVTWYKDGNLIRSNNRIKIAANKLTISAAEKNDAGSYSCDATNGYTSAARSVEIIVSEPVEVKLAGPKGPFRQGREIGIACNVAGYPIPTVTWYKDGNLIRSNNRIKIAANKLTISAAEKNDAGSYSCDATNGYTSAARSVAIIVSEPVEVKLAAPKGPFRQGQEIGIACNVAGYPIPTVTWYKDGNLIRWNNRIKIAANKLTISAAEKNDAGSYSCEANNGYTSAARSVEIIVSVPVTVNVSADSHQFTERSEFNISCYVDGFPVPRVAWFKDDTPIQPNNGIMISSGNTLIMISDADKSDSGRYRCQAGNEYSTAADAIDIQVAGIDIHPDCRDLWHDLCDMVVEAKTCNGRFIGRACCRSCTEAGMLPARGPHINETRRLAERGY